MVEDLPDVRATVAGLLLDEGYYVCSASGRAEALELLDAERFHVAVLDVRLDETNPDNEEGLQLMHQIKRKDPTTAVIILTGYATVKMIQEALRPNRHGIRLAYDFLEKTELDQIPEYVKLAIRDDLKIDWSLKIIFPEKTLTQLPKRIRFVHLPKPTSDQIVEEVDEILRKLFFDYAQVQIQPIRRGHSGTAILEIVPWYRDRGRGEALIAKIGEHTLVENEIVRYKNLVEGRVGGHRLPKTLTVARTRSLSGILYTFAGLGATRDFASFYQLATSSQIQAVLKNLFLETCFPWRHTSGFITHKANLKEAFLNHLRLNPKKLQDSLYKTFGGRHPFRRGNTDKEICIKDEFCLVNPVFFALTADFTADFSTSLIHGDLHGYNVLVDQHHETWLIDFADTGEGPILQDYASFETFIRLNLIKVKDWRTLHRWETALFNTLDISLPDLPLDLADVIEISKAHHAVTVIRQLALKQDKTKEAEKVYLIALLFNSLKILTIMDLPAIQRDHALISAALIAARLKTKFL